jgi:hypothetical protein
MARSSTASSPAARSTAPPMRRSRPRRRSSSATRRSSSARAAASASLRTAASENRRAFSIATAACEATAARRRSSSRPNAAGLRSMASMTPMTRPRRSASGAQAMLRVRYPVRRSTLGSKRRSAYASGTRSGRPVRATQPAMPRPGGRRISRTFSARTVLLHSSPLSRSMRKSVAPPAPRSCAARSTTIARSASMSSVEERASPRSTRPASRVASDPSHAAEGAAVVAARRSLVMVEPEASSPTPSVTTGTSGGGACRDRAFGRAPPRAAGQTRGAFVRRPVWSKLCAHRDPGLC